VHPDRLDGPEKGEKPEQTSAKLDAYAEKHSHKHAHGPSARWLDWRQVRESYPYVLNTLAETNFNEEEGIKKDINKDIKKLQKELKLDKLPALYEFAICHKDRQNKKFKVYIGKTDDLLKRQNEHLGYAGLKTLWPFFEFALRNRCMVMRRYAIIGSDENTSKLKVSKSLREEMKRIPDLVVYQLETRFLSVFDYAFNGREKGDKSSAGTNPPKRQLKVKVSRCCFRTSAKAEPAGVFHPDEWYHPPK